MIPGIDLPELVRAVGYVGLFGIVFAETGLLIGFFLPGDSLLFTAGILAGQGYLNIYTTIAVLLSAAIIGDSVGYSIGRKLGPRVFKRENSILFNKKHIKRAQEYFDKYGPMTIVIARFVPIIRTFAPTLAGVGNMNYGKFLFYNISGGVLWVFSVTLLGYYLGIKVENIDKYIIPGVIVIVLLSISPYIHKFIKSPAMRTAAKNYLIQVYRKVFPQKLQ
ncbi:MAG TPA: VTT domain-containing protein [Candidatus Doudnabacteria bacterium]|nr:VTT domain-containing protein [Candidatus Doudnabacteria bacterium]